MPTPLLIFLFGFLTLLACTSPLLTFSHLWQLKEWRWDRLREHVGREGPMSSLFGWLRPLILLVSFIALLVPDLRQEDVLLGTIGLLALLSILQLILRRQPTPIWTQKALVLTAAAFAINFAIVLLILSFASDRPLLLLALAFIQPLILASSFLTFLPLDRYLKQRTFVRARALRSSLSKAIVIGITGSVGKTTTKELIAHVLQNRSPLVTPAHVNTEMGVAKWLLEKLPSLSNVEQPLLVIEMGAYRIGEIWNLCSIVKPSIGVITFVGTQHLALFGSEQALLKAKGELLTSLPSDGHAFINGDCERCRGMRSMCTCPVTIIGTGGSNDLEAFDIEETTKGVRLSIGQTAFFVPIHGTHNAVNILLAVAVAEHLGISRAEVAEKLRSFNPPQHTFEVREEHGVTILDDTHNASITSFQAAIEWATRQPFERKILLTSGLIELGSEQERAHSELGSLSASVFSDVYFVNRKSAAMFAEGYGRTVHLVERKTPSVPPGALLVCIGRMPSSLIRRFLP